MVYLIFKCLKIILKFFFDFYLNFETKNNIFNISIKHKMLFNYFSFSIFNFCLCSGHQVECNLEIV